MAEYNQSHFCKAPSGLWLPDCDAPHTALQRLDDGQRFEGSYRVSHVIESQTVRNTPYLRLLLADHSGTMAAYYFGPLSEIRRELKTGSTVFLEARARYLKPRLVAEVYSLEASDSA